jgi:hypothetical protein
VTSVSNIRGGFNLSRRLDEILQVKTNNFKMFAAAVMRDAMRDTLGGIIEDTPVGDFDPSHAGTTKANWQLTQGSPAVGILASKSPNRNKNSIKIPRSYQELFASTWYFVNNSPSVNLLEFGGYRRSPKRGTYNKTTGKYEIRTSKGFSRQAPKGMYRLNINRWPKHLKRAIRKNKRLARVKR